ncbi:hypothetical protein MDAP_000066 [Mitosporidium daphniae]
MDLACPTRPEAEEKLVSVLCLLNAFDFLARCDAEIVELFMLISHDIFSVSNVFDEYFIASSFWLTLINLRKVGPDEAFTPYMLMDKVFDRLAINPTRLYNALLLVKSSSCLVDDAEALDGLICSVASSVEIAQCFFFVSTIVNRLSISRVPSDSQMFLLIRLCIFLNKSLDINVSEIYVLNGSISFCWRYILLSFVVLQEITCIGELDMIKCFTMLYGISKPTFSLDFFLLNCSRFSVSCEPFIERFFKMQGNVLDFLTFDLTYFIENSYVVDIEPIPWNDLQIDLNVSLLCSLVESSSYCARILCVVWKGFFDLYPSHTLTFMSPEFVCCINAISMIISNVDSYYGELLNEVLTARLALHSELNCSLSKIALLIGPTIRILSSHSTDMCTSNNKLVQYFNLLMDKWIWSSIDHMVSRSKFYLKVIVHRLKSTLSFFIKGHELQLSIPARRIIWQLVLFSITKARPRLLRDGISIDIVIMSAMYTVCRLSLVYPHLSSGSLSNVDEHLLSFRYILSIYLQDPSKTESSFRRIPIEQASSAESESDHDPDADSFEEADIITYYNDIFLPAIKPLLCDIEEGREDVFPEFLSIMNDMPALWTISGAMLFFATVLFGVNLCFSKRPQCADLKYAVLLAFSAYILGPSLNVFEYVPWAIFSLQFCKVSFALMECYFVYFSDMPFRNTMTIDHFRLLPSIAYVFGSWVGSLPLVLDWNSNWQYWPIPNLFCGITLSTASLVALIFGSRLDRSYNHVGVFKDL